MRIARTCAEMREWSRQQRNQGNTVGLVPTMGALHTGHSSLIRAAAKTTDAVAVSIFVNPTQFGPNEDFERYPRSFEADCALAEREGAQIVFAPTVEEMYPVGAATYVDVGELGDRLDGRSRPGHFRGVATVVAKLFVVAEADRAFFGQKDAAQIAVLRQMVADLRFATEVVVCPIVRDAGGLALSSRNIYLSESEHSEALALSRAIRKVEEMFAHGERSAVELIAAARAILSGDPNVKIDYIELVDWATLLPLEHARAGSLFAIATWVGTTRLIDNAVFA